MISKMNKIQYRSVKEYRAYEDENGIKFIEGYASVFNTRSKELYDWWEDETFFEYILPDAFNEVLERKDLNVICNYNHNDKDILARFVIEEGKLRINTLKLEIDEKGLKFTAELPNTTLARDLHELTKRGDLYECSFAFTEKEVRKSEDEDGNVIKEVVKVDNLFDVSIVTEGAYSTTDITARDYQVLERMLKSGDEEVKEKIKRKIEELNITEEVKDEKERNIEENENKEIDSVSINKDEAEIMRMKTALLKLMNEYS